MSKRGRYRKFQDDFDPEPWHSENEEDFSITANPEDEDTQVEDVEGRPRDNHEATNLERNQDSLIESETVGLEDEQYLTEDETGDKDGDEEVDQEFHNDELEEDDLIEDDGDDEFAESDEEIYEDCAEWIQDGQDLLGDGDDEVDESDEEFDEPSGEWIQNDGAEPDGAQPEHGHHDVDDHHNDVEGLVIEVHDEARRLPNEGLDADNFRFDIAEAEESDVEAEESDVEGDPGEFNEVEDYQTMLHKMSKEWLELELTHRVSKTASDAFWNFGKEWFPKLFKTKTIQKVRRKTPGFTHLRRRMYDQYVPNVKMEFGFKHKETGAITVVKDVSVAPVSRFPRHEYEKLWEIAKVEVNTFYFISTPSAIRYFCFLFGFSYFDLSLST